MSIFTQVQHAKVKTNTFDLSHDRKMSMNMGELVPIFLMECVPGDKIKMSTSQMLRFAPLISPVMHRINVYTHFFFVPNRIVWDNWEDFITGGEDGNDASVMPRITLTTIESGSLRDYMGLPNIAPPDPSMTVTAIPFAGYLKIYDEFYRDQNLIEKLDVQLLDGNNNATLNTLTVNPRRRAWQHDYFTSALPFTQKGAEATIPLGTSAEINYVDDSNSSILRIPGSGIAYEVDDFLGTGAALNEPGLVADPNDASPQPLQMDNSGQLVADLSTATAATINDLRQAYRLQEWLEKNARGGTRYTESIMAHFGVRSSDARLQRPEYLGGGSSPVTISEVLQTSSNDNEPTPQANMAGHGISVGANNGFNYYCEEHGYIFGIMSVLPKTAYQQGIPKHFRKFDKFDYFWPSFANLGEQAIQNLEIFYGPGDNSGTFGYTPRYAEYKYIPSSVHGEFRESLDFWHMGRIFADRPALNQLFIEAIPTDRIFAVLDAEKLYVHVHHRIKATRKMPYFGTPKM